MQLEQPSRLNKNENHKETVTFNTPEAAYAWIDQLIKTEEAADNQVDANRIRWQVKNILTPDAPGADTADESVLLSVNGRTVAAATIGPEHFIGAFVDPRYQNSGLGKKIIETAVKRLILRGAKKIHVEVADTRALRALEKLPKKFLDYLVIEDVRQDF